MHRKKEIIIKNENGMASIVIVILIMTLLSLIVISMTRNANREQKQALDRQLNSQAFYAAESGINDAKDYYTKHANDPVEAQRAPEQKDKCDGSETGATGNDQFPGYSSVVGNQVNHYSCVLYDATPESLAFSNVGTNNSVLMPIQDNSGNPINSLTFNWKRSNEASYDFSSCLTANPPRFPKQIDDNCDAGVLRIELIDPTGNTRAELISKNFIAFVSPFDGPPQTRSYLTGIVGAQRQGVNWRGGCAENNQCSITINNISRNKLLLHLRSIYKDNEVEITGINSEDENVQFKDGQMMVDATGRASDVLKRIRVREPLNEYGNGVYPEFSLQTAGTSLCKLLQIVPPGLPGAVSSSGC